MLSIAFLLFSESSGRRGVQHGLIDLLMFGLAVQKFLNIE